LADGPCTGATACGDGQSDASVLGVAPALAPWVVVVLVLSCDRRGPALEHAASAHAAREQAAT
jgi:hypothetical protein